MMVQNRSSYSNIKVLILGGGGFIGFEITKYLAKTKGYQVTIADSFSEGQRDPVLDKFCTENEVTVVAADFCDPQSFSKLEDHYHFVYMLASVVGVNRCLESPHEVVRINTSLILNSLEWLSKGHADRVLFSSSSECYAGTTDSFQSPIPTPESIPLCIKDTRHPRFTYAVTKMLGESGFFSYGKQYDFHVTVVRYQNIFGPRMGFKHAIPHIVQRFHQGETPYRVFGHDQTRAFCFVQDAVEGTVAALESDHSNGEVYHIGSSEEITIDELTRTIGGFVGYQGEYVPAPTYPGSVARRCPDISKATEHFGYKPNVHWKKGLEVTVRWYLAHFQAGRPVVSGGFVPPEELVYQETSENS